MPWLLKRPRNSVAVIGTLWKQNMANISQNCVGGNIQTPLALDLMGFPSLSKIDGHLSKTVVK